MPHRFLERDGYWLVEREFDQGYLGDGSKAEHLRIGRALIAHARKVEARHGASASRGVSLMRDGYQYTVYRDPSQGEAAAT